MVREYRVLQYKYLYHEHETYSDILVTNGVLVPVVTLYTCLLGDSEYSVYTVQVRQFHVDRFSRVGIRIRVFDCPVKYKYKDNKKCDRYSQRWASVLASCCVAVLVNQQTCPSNMSSSSPSSWSSSDSSSTPPFTTAATSAKFQSILF